LENPDSSVQSKVDTWVCTLEPSF